ncbi:MAG: hypothetical protein Q7S61_00875 [bacterium]|nr:hypothetical protein [bacterium]
MKKHLWVIFILIIIVITHFGLDFISGRATFFAPDVFLSDQIHLNYSFKHILANQLHNNLFPWWEETVAGGFPFIGESQIGAFYLPNIVLFRFLPYVLAYNFSYIVCFLLAMIGCHLLFYEKTKNKIISSMGAIGFVFSAPFYLQMVHMNLLQTYSLIPLIFYFYLKYFQSKKIKYILLTAICISQQIFAGYIMTPFMTIVFLSLYCLLHLLFSDKRKVSERIKIFNSSTQTIKIMVVITFLSICLSFIQIVPQLEYSRFSNRAHGVGTDSLAASLDISFLKTLWKLDGIGSLKNGFDKAIYNHYQNLMWDGNLYIGAGIFIFTLFSLFYLKGKYNLQVKLTFFLSFCGLILAMGKNSPLYILYLLPGFNFFRTPSRFTIFFSFFFIWCFVLIFNQLIEFILKRYGKNLAKVLLIGLCSIVIMETIFTYIHYFPTIRTEGLAHDKVGSFITSHYKGVMDGDYYIYQVGGELVWKITMDEWGWKDMDIYKFLLQYQIGNISTTRGIYSKNYFSGSDYFPQTYYESNKLLEKKIYKDGLTWFTNELGANSSSRILLNKIMNQKTYLSAESIYYLRSRGIKLLISPFEFSDSKYVKKVFTDTTKFQNITYKVHVYEMSDPYEKHYIPDLISIYDPSNVSNNVPNNTQKIIEVSENDYFLISGTGNNAKDKITYSYVKKQNGAKAIVVNAPYSGVLASTQSNYPGWKAYIDGKPARVLTININQRGLSIPKGTRTIEFKYEPRWLLLSIFVSSISYVVIFLLLLIYFKKKP